MDATLIFFKPDGTRKDMPLSEGTYVIGRGDGASLRVPLGSISRSHCQLKVSEDSLVAEDLGSLNGTFVNGKQIESPTALAAGDVVKVGDCKIAVQINGEPADVQIPSDALSGSSMVDTPMPASRPLDDNATSQPGVANEGSSEFDFDFDFGDDDK